MSEARVLDDQILGALERRWRQHGASTPNLMQPGLTDEEIDDVAAPLGFPLPDELRTLYRWQNGSGPYRIAWGRSMWPLDVAVTAGLEHRRDDEFWRPGWILLLSERPYVAADCLANGQHGPVPVWHYDVEWDPPTRPSFASIGDMVAFWIELIDDDVMYWDGGLWQLRDDRVTEETMRGLSGVPED